MNYTEERDCIWHRIREADTILIYGAQVVAYGIYQAIKALPDKKVKAFLVSSLEDNPPEIDGIPVVIVNNKNLEDALIIIATPQIYHTEIESCLSQMKAKELLFIDSHAEYLIMSRYFKSSGYIALLEDYPLTDDNTAIPEVKMYMAKCHKDKKLLYHYTIPYWIEQIQAGAALTGDRISELVDNTGNNISYKNYNYSELTVMYWIWKNRSEDYVGVCHYRRMLRLDEEDLRKIRHHNINVVLPLPYVCYPDASGQYGRYITTSDMQMLLQALQEVSPEYYYAAGRIFKEPLLYNYNMFLADRNTFQVYCEWLFPILSKTAELCEPSGIKRNDRYIGYMGEVLTALYFLYNKEKLKIAHVEKIWMV